MIDAKNLDLIDDIKDKPVWGQMLYQGGYVKLTNDDEDAYLWVFGILGIDPDIINSDDSRYYEENAYSTFQDFADAVERYRKSSNDNEGADYLYKNALESVRKWYSC